MNRCKLSLAACEAHPPPSCPFYLAFPYLRHGAVLHAWNVMSKPSIRNISYTKLCTQNLLLNVSAPGNLFAPLWNCCQLTRNQPHQSLQLSLQSFIPTHLAHNHQVATSPEMPGFSWTALRTGVGRFVANMKIMDLSCSNLCECGKVQTAHHILHDCTTFKPPCHIYEVDNHARLELSC